MSFMEKTAKHFALIKAARQIVQEIEKAGLENLKLLAEAGESIVGTYLQGCSPQEQAIYRAGLNSLARMGVTAEEVLDEVTRQMPKLAPIIKSKDSYRRSEIAKIMSFIK